MRNLTNIFKKLFSLALILILLAQPSSAFFGFGDDDDERDRRDQPVRIRLNTFEGPKNLVSNEPVTLKLRLLYRDNVLNDFRRVSVFALEDIVNQDIEYKKAVGDAVEDLDLNFTLQRRKVRSRISDYYEAVFISDPITIDTPQRISAQIRINKLLEGLDLTRENDNKTIFKSVQVKPIDVFIKKATITDVNTSDFQNYSATVNFSFNLLEDSNLKDIKVQYLPNLNLNQTLTVDGLEFTKDKRDFIPFLRDRRNRRIIKLNVEDIVDTDVAITQITENTYQGSFNVDFTTKLTSDFKRLGKGRLFNIRLPFILETTNAEGLAVRVRIIGKANRVEL
jgi:hypothetical protein